jgi:hypothetical protein
MKNFLTTPLNFREIVWNDHRYNNAFIGLSDFFVHNIFRFARLYENAQLLSLSLFFVVGGKDIK